MIRIIREFTGIFLVVIFVSLLLFVHVDVGVVFGIAFIWLIVRGWHIKYDENKDWCIDEKYDLSWSQDDLWGDEQTIQELPAVQTLSEPSIDTLIEILVNNEHRCRLILAEIDRIAIETQ